MQAGLAWEPGLRESLLSGLALPDALHYEPSPFGLPACRRAVSDYYLARGRTIDPLGIVLTASTSEAYAALFKLLCDPGDGILVPEPSYPLFEYLSALEGVATAPYELSWDGRWSLDPHELSSRIQTRTRAVVCVAPNNPTGSYLQESEWQRIDEICAERGLALIVDEVFADYPRDGSQVDRLSPIAGCPSRALTFCLSGLSKVAALPQMKLGWIVAQGDPFLLREALARLEIVLDASLSVGTPIQLAAPEILRQLPALQAPIVARVALNARCLVDLLSHHPTVREVPSEGGWYAVLRIPATRSEEEWVLALLEQDGVLVHPGYFFDFPGEAYLVVSMLTPPDTFHEAVTRVLGRVTS